MRNLQDQDMFESNLGSSNVFEPLNESDEFEYELEAEVNRRSPIYIKWVQRSLNKLLGTRLRIDGIIGPQTRSAVRRFQGQSRIRVDGIVGPQTERALILKGTDKPPTAVTDLHTGATPTSPNELKQNILIVAIKEWEKWGRGVIKETDPRISTTLQDYWASGVGRRYTVTQLRSAAFQSDNPWSAAFISWVMRKAGAGNAFRYSAAHATYIVAAKENRLANNSNPFKAFRIKEVKPELGDLVCKRRAGSGATYDNIRRGMKTHCDIVSSVHQNSIKVIGGNVNNSVSMRTISIDSNGFISNSRYFAVIKVGASTSVSPDITTPMSQIEAGSIRYTVVPGQEYGPKWKSRRPPGLPSNARLTSGGNGALAHVERIARGKNLGEIFVKTVAHLAQTESGAMFARPANIFDARPESQRPSGKRLITAWGVFQFNRGAWRGLKGVSNTAYPWNSTPVEEISLPVQKYASLFSEVISVGGGQINAAKAIRIWHIGPAIHRIWLRFAKERGGNADAFRLAWDRLRSFDPRGNSRDIKARINRHLGNAGVSV